MNKGKLIIQTIRLFRMEETYRSYKCNRCGVIILEKNWKGDTHSKCNEYLKGKRIREKAERKALSHFWIARYTIIRRW